VRIHPKEIRFTAAFTTALLAACALALASGLHAEEAKPNVIFITIDTLRADHLACYGYRQIQTPNIDALARSAARFSHAYTPVPISLPAHTAIFTGSFPMATGMHDSTGNTLPASAVTLAEVLRDNGYATAAFLGSAVLDSRFGLNQGFDTYFDHFDLSRLDGTNRGLLERRGDAVMDAALDWLKRNRRQPFLLWVHLYDPHSPYAPPQPYATTYRTHPYDGEIAFDDAQLARLLSFLKQTALDSNALMVLAGDHGEGLGEHGEKTHGLFIYNSTLQVPLLIKVPSAAPRVVEGEVSLVDVMPTILQALRIPIPPSVQGRSLLSEILGHPAAGSSNVFAETYLPMLHFRWSQLLGLQWNGLKYIEAPRPELYDTRADPHETRNLFAVRRSVAHDLHDKLFSLLRRYTATSGGATSEKELADPALLERLHSLGYVAVSAGTFTEASGKPLRDPKDRLQVYELISDARADGQQGRYQESLRKLREAEKAEPGSLQIRYLTGLDYYRMNDFRHAAESFRAALHLDPQFGWAAAYLGLSQSALGDLDGAGVSFQRALELNPANCVAAFNLGAAYARQKRTEAAIEAFQRAVEILPEYAAAYEALGELYLSVGRAADAVHALEEAVQLAPGSRKAHYHLGRAYQAQGRTADAQRELQRAPSP